ncbi:MAG: bifunctional folylpolyglutamate synthase/dihydrofolate synthase [Lentisphaeria bacterium]|nr:bifunctional folylpolyglutamate synthase/dihydrofolate synthase [Lentisphaeria bacterium]
MKNFNEANNYLNGFINSGIKLGLDNIRELCEAIGNPQERLRCIHVAGTNGKGSICAMMASILKAHGYKVGFFSSPHLVSIRERLRINGAAISEADFTSCVTELAERAADFLNSGSPPTYFELITAMGFLHFEKEAYDIAIIEVGMGGRLDSSNILSPAASVISSIDFDHTEALGNTLEEIAFEKAGIIKSSAPVISGVIQAQAKAVIQKTACDKGCDYYSLNDDFSVHSESPGSVSIQSSVMQRTLDFKMSGDYQLRNLAVAIQTLDALEIALDIEKVNQALASYYWPARMDLLSDGILLDAAHNPAGIANIVDEMHGKKWALLFGALNNKDWQSMLEAVLPYCETVYLSSFDHPKCEDPETIKSYIYENYHEISVQICELDDTLVELREANNSIILGSLYLAGEVLKRYYEGPIPIEIS